jgi:predicted transcriptional regulator
MNRPALNLSNPAAVRAWLDDLSGRVDDLADAAEDQTAPIAARTLGRAKARELIQDARGTLAALVALARAGLPTDPDATPTEPGVALDPDEPPWVTAGERVTWEDPAARRHLPPAERVRKALLHYFDRALPNGLRGEYAAEVGGLVDDIIAAALAKLRDDDHGDPAGLGDVGPAGAE